MNGREDDVWMGSEDVNRQGPGPAPRRSRMCVPGPRVRMLLVPLLCLLGAVLGIAATALWRVRPAAITIGQRTMFLRPSHDPMQRTSLIVHEAVHREQFRRVGLIRFLYHYLADPAKRLAWEAEAIATNLCRARAQRIYSVRALQEFYAAELRSYRPFGSLSRVQGREYLERAYQDGAACATLMSRLIVASPELVGIPGIPGPAGTAAAP